MAHLRRVLEASPVHGEGDRTVWAKLRVEGRRTATERVRRLMREHDLHAPSRTGHAHGPTAHDGTITPEAPDVMWGTDLTATVTVAEGPACVFVAVDHCTAECIGRHAAKPGTRFEALEPIRPGMRDRFGGIGDGVARGLRLRHDHGSHDLADDFQQAVAFFGIASSPSVVREPKGACAAGLCSSCVCTQAVRVVTTRAMHTPWRLMASPPRDGTPRTLPTPRLTSPARPGRAPSVSTPPWRERGRRVPRSSPGHARRPRAGSSPPLPAHRGPRERAVIRAAL